MEDRILPLFFFFFFGYCLCILFVFMLQIHFRCKLLLYFSGILDKVTWYLNFHGPCIFVARVVHFVTLLCFKAAFAYTPGVATNHQGRAFGTSYIIIKELIENRERNMQKWVLTFESPSICVCAHVCVFPHNLDVMFCVNYSYCSHEQIWDVSVVSHALSVVGWIVF